MIHTPASLISPTCFDGPTQMAIDQALLLATADDGEVRFRFYTWSQPTVSLGYFQDYDSFLKEFPQLAHLALVRRLTGGGAIIHDREITYCLTAPIGHRLFEMGSVELYSLIHQAVIDLAATFGADLSFGQKSLEPTSQTRGPHFCFARNYPTDLKSRLGKVVGSAQRRLTKAVLQHGSIIFENRFDPQPAAGLNALAGNKIDQNAFRDRLTTMLADRLQLDFAPRDLLPTESAAAERIRVQTSGNIDWIRLGRKSDHRPLSDTPGE